MNDQIGFLRILRFANRSLFTPYHEKTTDRMQDRIFWGILSESWKEWPNLLIVVKPETVIRWHKKGFTLFWGFKSRESGPGRPPLASKTRKLIEDRAKSQSIVGRAKDSWSAFKAMNRLCFRMHSIEGRLEYP
jgi:hypothetical protein